MDESAQAPRPERLTKAKVQPRPLPQMLPLKAGGVPVRLETAQRLVAKARASRGGTPAEMNMREQRAAAKAAKRRKKRRAKR